MPAPFQAFDFDIAKLKQFHAAHFPAQPLPNIGTASAEANSTRDQQVAFEEPEEEDDDDHGLGYYEDGVKRTLTEEQIKMFRHSEIQRLLAAKRHAAEAEEGEAQDPAKRQEKLDDAHSGPRTNADTGKNEANTNRVEGRGKRKAHFDQPQSENGDVVLEY